MPKDPKLKKSELKLSPISELGIQSFYCFFFMIMFYYNKCFALIIVFILLSEKNIKTGDGNRFVWSVVPYAIYTH